MVLKWHDLNTTRRPLGDAGTTSSNTTESLVLPPQQDQSKDYSQPLDINAATPTTHNVDIDATVPLTTDNSAIATLTPDTEPSPPSTGTIPLAADDQQPPLLPPQTDDVERTLELFITHNPELTASDIAMLALEPRLRETDQAFLKMVLYAWRASRTLQAISLQRSHNLENPSNSFPTEPALNDEAAEEDLADVMPPDDNTSAPFWQTFTPNTHRSVDVAKVGPASFATASNTSATSNQSYMPLGAPGVIAALPKNEASVEELAEAIPPEANNSLAFTLNTYSEDLALRHSRNASLTDTEREQMQAEEDRVLQGNFPRNASLTEHREHSELRLA